MSEANEDVVRDSGGSPNNGSSRSGKDAVPWQQRLFDSIWLLAVAAILYFFVSYVGWGLFDVFSVHGGG